MEKYYLITVKNNAGFTATFVEKGMSTYSALLNKVVSSKGQHGFLHSNWDSIIFSEEATEKDYELFQKTKEEAK